MSKLQFNPRNLSPYEQWVFATLKDIQDRLKKIEEQMLNPRDFDQRRD